MALYASWNDSRVTSARVTLTAWGRAVVDVQIAEDDPIVSQGLLTIGDFAQVAHVLTTGPYGGSRAARLVAGFGGWHLPAPRQFYSDANGIKLGAVLRDVAARVGETVAIGNAQGAASVGVRWNRQEGPAARTLALLVGEGWYVDAAGVTQIGERPTFTITSEFDVVQPVRRELGLYTIAAEDLAQWRPGAVFAKPGIVDDPQTISSVSIAMMGGGKLRLEVLANL